MRVALQDVAADDQLEAALLDGGVPADQLGPALGEAGAGLVRGRGRVEDAPAVERLRHGRRELLPVPGAGAHPIRGTWPERRAQGIPTACDSRFPVSGACGAMKPSSWTSP